MKLFTAGKFKLFSILVVAVMAYAAVRSHGDINIKNGAYNMNTQCIGRFSIAVPAGIKQVIRSSKLRSVEIKEVVWPENIAHEQARMSEWNSFLTSIAKLTPPKGANKVIVRTDDFHGAEKWCKGAFFYDNNNASDEGTWTLLMDAGNAGVWLKSNPVIIEKENVSHKVVNNFVNIAKAYHYSGLKALSTPLPGHKFYLQHGVIDLPYLVDEESIARFEGHPLDLKLLIEMEMDVRHEIEPMGLISKTRGMLIASLITPGGSISKIRLRKREVAGMPGEEAVLKVREGHDTDLVFTWEYNGKDDSGEYPTTRINMESPGGNLNEKLKIWDAILDSMQPMFERKKVSKFDQAGSK